MKTINTMTRAIYFDMDGTIANLYGVDDWLDYLIKEQTKPYREAKTLIDMRVLGRELNRLKKCGYVVGVVSWLSKCGTDDYNERVTQTKMRWLKDHIGAVEFDEIHIVTVLGDDVGVQNLAHILPRHHRLRFQRDLLRHP